MTILPSDKPNLSGPHGKAWRQDLDGFIAKHPEQASMRDTSVDGYLVYAPYAHPAWHSYMIACVNLRDMPGVPAAKINLPGATHEVLVFALDPRQPMALDEFPSLLHPANFCGQFIEASDDAARERIKKTVQDVIDGTLSPDTDFTRHWINRFSASNIKGDPKTAGETRITLTDADGAVAQEIVIPPVPGPQDLN